MLERQMEDLIAAYPEEFFPGKGFELRGRQGYLAEVGRYDLRFEDRYGTKILMELKAVTAKFEHASQLAKYKDELRLRGETRILMWLVAPHLPHSVREQLDALGIEYTEIHEAQFRQVADRYGVSLSEPPLPLPEAPSVGPATRKPGTSGDSEASRSAFRTDVDHDSEVMPISIPN
jgi:RecB family endonuclease NucS